jgi:hypothetical protein
MSVRYLVNRRRRLSGDAALGSVSSCQPFGQRTQLDMRKGCLWGQGLLMAITIVEHSPAWRISAPRSSTNGRIFSEDDVLSQELPKLASVPTRAARVSPRPG